MTTNVAHYNLLERIGSGPLGELYRARDTKVGRTVALRVVSHSIATDPARFSRLLADARAATGVSHPNVATLFDVGEEVEHPYLSHEFAAGRLLSEEIDGSPINPRRALDLVLQIADGLADAHASGVIHGDLRPDTIIVTAKGSAKILECGFASWTRGGALRVQAAQDLDRLPSDANDVVAYLSPEQAVGVASDVRSDVFMLGTLAYEMLTGRNPFSAAAPADTVINVIRRKLPLVSEANSAVPTEVDGIVARALSRNIEDRYQTAASFAAALRTISTMLDVREGDAATPSGLMPLDDKPDRHGTAVLFAALGVAVLAAIVVWWFLARS
ncbi:MAG TPA: serine/threonine-protein kinase [Vicinamibacterales bacterium]|jgi:serine/threonine protein kinase|nr:serine/threonine-protein kinase [Vicinamibacterales bacterium]